MRRTIPRRISGLLALAALALAQPGLCGIHCMFRASSHSSSHHASARAVLGFCHGVSVRSADHAPIGSLTLGPAPVPVGRDDVPAVRIAWLRPAQGRWSSLHLIPDPPPPRA